ncbi:MAG: hypothetical protein SFY56_06055 [Bacteroidota bacterium]|nr:hypothetical protein [Bacteroidota bacterium]
MRLFLNNSPSIESIKQALQIKFPEFAYSFQNKGKVLVVQKTLTAGVLITYYRNILVVNASFPTAVGQNIFVFSLLFFGIIIPAIVYFAVFYKNQKQVRVEVVDFLNKQFNKTE